MSHPKLPLTKDYVFKPHFPLESQICPQMIGLLQPAQSNVNWALGLQSHSMTPKPSKTLHLHDFIDFPLCIFLFLVHWECVWLSKCFSVCHLCVFSFKLDECSLSRAQFLETQFVLMTGGISPPPMPCSLLCLFDSQNLQLKGQPMTQRASMSHTNSL